MLVFTGPSGVGKTQLAEHLAAILHKDGGPVGECLKQIPMNQYQEEGEGQLSVKGSLPAR